MRSDTAFFSAADIFRRFLAGSASDRSAPSLTAWMDTCFRPGRGGPLARLWAKHPRGDQPLDRMLLCPTECARVGNPLRV